MRSHPRLLVGLLPWVAVAAQAADGGGLNIDSEQLAWPQWHARLFVASEPVVSPVSSIEALTLRPRSAALLGDYYMARPYFGQTGGLRLTSGLMLGPRGGVFGANQTSLSGMFSVATISRTGLVGLPSTGDGSLDGSSTWPYLGIGYSDSSLRSGFSFSADVGLAAPGQSVLRAARGLGNQSLDDTVRDLRLTPMLQLGVSYRF